jgi:hypothetical protein
MGKVIDLTEAAIERAAIKSMENMGPVEFDRIEDMKDGTTVFYDGDRVSMIMNTQAWNDYKKQMGLE